VVLVNNKSDTKGMMLSGMVNFSVGNWSKQHKVFGGLENKRKLIFVLRISVHYIVTRQQSSARTIIVEGLNRR
jgi:hypothetical protein